MKQLLVLNISPQLEEDMVDYLLDIGQAAFTSYQARGHGSNLNLSIAEQVSGRRKRVQFEMMIDEDKVQPLLEGLEQAVGTDIVYWLQPILLSGKI